MKKTMILSLMLTVVFGLAGMAQNKTEKFKVYGKCGMCKARIEKAATSVEGVSAANWSDETKMIEVTFDGSKTDVHKVNMAIADAGHDTDMKKAKDEAYNVLPGCCQYERASGEKMDMKGKKGGCKM